MQKNVPSSDNSNITLNPASPNADDNSSERSPRVLVVDDNIINLRVLTAYLRKRKIPQANILPAVNGLEAVQSFSKFSQNDQSFDIVFMDLNMPIMDGFQAVKEIRAFEWEWQRPRAMIVALTGLVSERDQARAFGAGIDKFFSKPFSSAELESILEDWRQQRVT